ncbi:hypothetical protein LX99_04280 [Mucilaginibacter oryzae]|uniref:Outer membrane protein with beta-barrel domain n=2 Tax=Mucilaginibacter oryzae TaxID=468058 RepID=A0A316H2J2_9SPHI|nr:hypothetical protein LX99_04280 [Mucilaginibacter oryzae]
MKYICLLLLIVVGGTAFSAPANLGFVIAKHQLTADSDTIIRKRSVSAGVSYGSDVLFFGRTGPVKYPFVTADLIYNTKSGLFLYSSAFKVLGYAPVDEVDVGGGYFYKFSKAFSGSASYTRFFFARDAAKVIKSASSNDINFKNSYDWKYLKSSVVLDYLFGKSNDFFVTVSHSKYWESSWSIFDDQDYLSFNPAVNFILGTQNFVQRYSLDHNFRDEASNIAAHFDPRYAARNRRFNMLNYSFKIPVAYNRPHYTFEFSYKYSIPVNVEGVLLNRRESFYNLTFYYVFY